MQNSQILKSILGICFNGSHSEVFSKYFGLVLGALRVAFVLLGFFTTFQYIIHFYISKPKKLLKQLE